MRDIEYMAWVRGLGCLFELTSYSCDGSIDAHHAGIDKGMGRKSDDNTCIPLCRKHHQDIEQLRGLARGWEKSIRRAFHAQAITAVRELHSALAEGDNQRISDAKYEMTFSVDYLTDPARAANAWYMRPGD